MAGRAYFYTTYSLWPMAALVGRWPLPSGALTPSFAYKGRLCMFQQRRTPTSHFIIPKIYLNHTIYMQIFFCKNSHFASLIGERMFWSWFTSHCTRFLNDAVE